MAGLDRRLDLHRCIVALGVTKNVYYQPPSTVRMKYPCIRYEKAGEKTAPADNIRYMARTKYKVTVIDSDPDSAIPDALIQLPYCSLVSCYTADNMHHFVFDLYY